jgi:hypothetical protein
MNYWKNIFDPSIFAYLIIDRIIKNIHYMDCVTSKSKTNINFNSQIQYNLNPNNQKQKKINDIKREQINYYNKKFTKEWIRNYNINQIIKKELIN